MKRTAEVAVGAALMVVGMGEMIGGISSIIRRPKKYSVSSNDDTLYYNSDRLVGIKNKDGVKTIYYEGGEKAKKIYPDGTIEWYNVPSGYEYLLQLEQRKKPDGSREFYRDGFLVRTISPTGEIVDRGLFDMKPVFDFMAFDEIAKIMGIDIK